MSLKAGTTLSRKVAPSAGTLKSSLGKASPNLLPLIKTFFRLWREQRLGQYGRKEAEPASTIQSLIPSRADTISDTSVAPLQMNGQGGQDGRGPPKNGVTWGPVGSGGSPKTKKGDKFRCCSLM